MKLWLKINGIVLKVGSILFFMLGILYAYDGFMNKPIPIRNIIFVMSALCFYVASLGCKNEI